MSRILCVCVCLIVTASLSAADASKELQAILAKEVLTPKQTMSETQEFCEKRIPQFPEFKSAADFDKYADQLRRDVLDKVVFRGAAVGWRDAKLGVEYLDTIKGGTGYQIKKLRYEALPGLWIPALLYEPEKLSGKVPVHLAVNGHDGNGKQAPYKQIRCINLAKRGIISLNVEWLGMGQLRTDGFYHYRMNQLDLCGTAGIAPFYLCMKRGLDVVLAHEHADPQRVAVSGLSGGGWQTIFISSLDTRVTLANPVAGYSSFRTRARFLKDLGDSEQTPCDLATVADYTHLTAIRAPRPMLLTFNSKDNCCFESGYALPPLLAAAEPVYKLHGKDKALRSHVNDDPGDHNYGKDNRQALYRMIGAHFFPGDTAYSADEIPSDTEVKTREELMVPLPEKNNDFNMLALALAKSLPREPDLPKDKGAAPSWRESRVAKLRQLVKAKDYKVQVTKSLPKDGEQPSGVTANTWKLRLDDQWTVPVVELVKGAPKKTTILIGDAGRKALSAEVEKLLGEGQRVLAVDPFYFGEAKVAEKDFLFALLVAAVGERPLGIQASQLVAVARWANTELKAGEVSVVAVGPRTSAIALVAAALDDKAIARLELTGAFGSLKEVIERNTGVSAMPELFCFGLLESFDLLQLAALSAPRPVQFVKPSERVQKDLSPLRDWYKTLGMDFDPLK